VTATIPGATFMSWDVYHPRPKGRIRRFMRDRAGSQPDHEFPAQGGSRRSREDRKAAAVEFKRPPAESAGHSRTCNQDGSDTCASQATRRVSADAIYEVVHSNDGGLTWSAPVTAADVSGRSAFFGSISADPAGNVNLVVQAMDDVAQGTAPGAGVVTYDSYFAQSTDRGKTWSTPILVSTASSDPDGSSTNSLAAQFLGDYITTVSDSGGGSAFAVWTDSRNATSCSAVDALRAGTAPKPDVITQCPLTFGNTDIFLGKVSY
jgi:hypothetical protein